MFDKSKVIHFIGIGGYGMSSVAKMYFEAGYQVQGSDNSKSVNNYNELLELGIIVFDEHKPQNLDQVDIVITNAAIAPDNIEYQIATAKGLQIVHRAEALNELVKDKKHIIAVSGTHGKSTTSTILRSMLASLNPTYLIGTKVMSETGQYEIGGKFTESEYAVIEADESDKSFLHYQPEVTIINNIELDHIDTNPAGLDEIKHSFELLVKQTTGAVFANFDDDNVIEVVGKTDKKVVPFSSNSFVSVAGSEFRYGLETFDFNMIGEHNFMNSIAAILVSHYLGLSFDEIRENMVGFQPPYRRLNTLGTFVKQSEIPADPSLHLRTAQQVPAGMTNRGKQPEIPAFAGMTEEVKRPEIPDRVENDAIGITVLDDHADHPTEVAATLSTIKKAYPNSRVLVVFQIVAYWRVVEFQHQWFEALYNNSDFAINTAIVKGRNPVIPGVTAKTIFEHEVNDGHLIAVEDKYQAADQLIEMAEDGDVIVILGAGDIGDLRHYIPSEIAASTSSPRNDESVIK
jgi:UDP-N-acetylmuramate--alanine ligase